MLNLIWDLDGTLINSEEEVYDSIVKAIADNGLDAKKAVTPLRVGPTIDVLLRTSFSEDYMTEEKLAGVIKSFRKIYDNSDFDKTPAFDGMREIIENNKFSHYVLTNKPDFPSKRILQKLGFDSSVRRLVTPYTFGTEKKLTKPELFKRLIEEEKLDVSSTFGIGDMQTDEKAAHSAGIKALGVLWGTGTKKELSGCDEMFESVAELKEFLEKSE